MRKISPLLIVLVLIGFVVLVDGHLGRFIEGLQETQQAAQEVPTSIDPDLLDKEFLQREFYLRSDGTVPAIIDVDESCSYDTLRSELLVSLTGDSKIRRGFSIIHAVSAYLEPEDLKSVSENPCTLFIWLDRRPEPALDKTTSLIGATKVWNRNEGDDLRFFSAETTDPYTDTANKFAHWVEGNDDLKKTDVWVKVDNIPALTSKTIHLYYGKAGAPGESDSGIFESKIDSNKPVLASYNMDEGRGTFIHDKSGNGNHGTFTNEVINYGTLQSGNEACADGPCPTWLDGKYGKALRFDGTDDFVKISNFWGAYLGDNYKGSITITAWIKPSGGNGFVIADGNNNEGYIKVESANSRVVYNFQGATTNLALSNPADWHFVALTTNGNGTNMTVYLDGQNKTVAQAACTGSCGPDGNMNLGTNYSGIIDDVRIYNRSLSQAEVANIYSSNTFIRGALAAYFRLDEGSGITTTDTHIWDNGVYKSAISLDGINDYVSVSDSPALQPTAAVAVEMWVKPSRNYTEEADAWFGGAIKEGTDYRLGWQGYTDGWTFDFYNSSGSRFFLDTTDKYLIKDNWHHVIGQYDGSKIEIYINGALVSSKIVGQWQIKDSTGLLKIGYASGYFAGAIDNVRIYNRALAAAEIASLYNNRAYDATDGAGSVLVPKYASPLPTIVIGAAEERGDYLHAPITITNPTSQDLNGFQVKLSAPAHRAITGEGVEIAIIDSGIDYTHPDLKDKMVKWGIFLPGDAENPRQFCDPTDYTDPIDKIGHGTLIASIAAGTGESSGGAYMGVAPGAKLWAVKMFGKSFSCAGGYSDFIPAIEFATDPNGDGNFDDRADIASISWGYLGFASYYSPTGDPGERAVNAMAERGTLPVVTAGNPLLNYEHYGTWQPGSAKNAISVGQSNKADVWVNAEKGPAPRDRAIKPDLVAPGVSIIGAKRGGGYTTGSGTSFSTPHVAGSAALLKQMHPDWSTAELKAALTWPAKDLGKNATWQGSGRLDVGRSAEMKFKVDKSQLLWTADEMDSSSSYLSAAPDSAEQVLSVTNTGNEEITFSVFAEEASRIGFPLIPVYDTQKYKIVTAVENSVTIQPGTTGAIKFTADFPELYGNYYGTIVLGTKDGSYRIPYLLEVEPIYVEIKLPLSYTNTNVGIVNVSITAPDGRTMTIKLIGYPVIATVALDGRVLFEREAYCKSAGGAAHVVVEGNLTGVKGNGTWTFTKQGVSVPSAEISVTPPKAKIGGGWGLRFSYKGKTFNDVSPKGEPIALCSEADGQGRGSEAGRPEPVKTWNWHMSGYGAYSTYTGNITTPEENPAFTQLYPSAPQ